MELSYKQLEATLLAHFQIHPDRSGTFRSRIKQLQRMNFPSDVNIGRGAKMVYTASHLLQMVTAFELIGSRVPAQSAKELVQDHWDELKVSFASSMILREPILAYFISRSFGDIQINKGSSRGHMPNSPNASTLIVADFSYFSLIFGEKTRRRSFLYPVLCVSELWDSLIGCLANAGVRNVQSDPEIRSWLPTLCERVGMMDQWLFVASLSPPQASAMLASEDALALANKMQSPDNKNYEEAFRKARTDYVQFCSDCAYKIIDHLSLDAKRELANEENDFSSSADPVMRELTYYGLIHTIEGAFRRTIYGEAVSDAINTQDLEAAHVDPET